MAYGGPGVTTLAGLGFGSIVVEKLLAHQPAMLIKIAPSNRISISNRRGRRLNIRGSRAGQGR